jgi:hypothetical protein
MISSRLFNSLVAAVVDLAGALLSEGSVFMKAKSKCCVVGLCRHDLGWDFLNLIKQEKCRKEGTDRVGQPCAVPAQWPAGISPLAKPPKAGYIFVPEK